ncbi:hypothetical protein DOZ80_10480 [Pseudomonas fluorescens]|uniref:EthD domain-containing protein n=2 Tax=Pseudomonas fluorescens TaxID=294 RepID=A0A327N9S8_PSEFL|nr:hypothetical protein DOZ80_10480 [Pseudomonas fluorescens]
MEAFFGSVPVLYRRPEVHEDIFYKYWHDIHGSFVAKFVGPYRYRQLHFLPYDRTIWQSEVVDKDLHESRQLGGTAEFIFDSEAKRAWWLQNVGIFADSDDATVFRRSASYNVSLEGFSSPGGSIANPAVDESSYRIFAMLVANEPGAAFKEYVHRQLGPLISAAHGVKHVQVTSYEPYQTPTREYFGGVDVGRHLLPDEQHQASIEIVFENRVEVDSFFINAFKPLEAEFAQRVKRVHAYQIRGAYTLIENELLTLAGFIGVSASKIVSQLQPQSVMVELEKANELRAQEISKIFGGSNVP